MKTITDDTKMIGRTKTGDPVWREWKGRPFLVVNKGQEIKPLPWWWWLPNTFRRLPEPHLSYGQVATANEKATKLLKALRNGPVYIKNGLIYSRASRVIMTKSIAEIVLHWMRGNGFVFFHQKLKDGRIRLDLDVEATRANNVT